MKYLVRVGFQFLTESGSWSPSPFDAKVFDSKNEAVEVAASYEGSVTEVGY